MRTILLRPLLALFATALAALGSAGTITVTSPTANAFLGTGNTLSFNISDASVEVKVTALVTNPSGATSTFQTTVSPGTDGKVSGTIGLTFGNASPEGPYSIKVTATEVGNAYNDVPAIPVNVDVVAPKFIELSPVSGSFTKGIVRIRASLQETSLKDWRVKVNDQDIPNGTGEGNDVSVDYDPANLSSDQALSISIVATDQANNRTTKTISVTLDRVKPTVQIVYPTSSTKISSKQDVTVLVDVTDASVSSLDRTGIDVIAKRTDGVYIARVTLVSLKSTNGATQRWTGRIRYVKGLLPSRFVLSASVIDKAGNVATLQEVTVRYGN